MSTLNVCTAVLPAASFDQVVEIAHTSGYAGIELRVDAQYHKSLDDLQREGARIMRQLEQAQLQLPVLSSYIPLNDQRSIDRLLACCQNMGARKARVVLPRSCEAAVVRQAQTPAIIPSYDGCQEPRALVDTVQATLARLERQAAVAGVQLLVELHWGTVMSSFSSAYFFVRDLHPDHIVITFDPANMLIEGKEDWEYGIKLIQPHLANVHVKNVRWQATPNGWVWAWSPLMHGMVNWAELITLLKRNNYTGDYAIEDFLTPSTSISAATAHVSKLRSQFNHVYHQSNAAETHPGEPVPVQGWRRRERVIQRRTIA